MILVRPRTLSRQVGEACAHRARAAPATVLFPTPEVRAIRAFPTAMVPAAGVELSCRPGNSEPPLPSDQRVRTNLSDLAARAAASVSSVRRDYPSGSPHIAGR